MKHAVITTCNFEDDVLFFKYFRVMKDVYAPSIISQTNKNFKLLIHVNTKKQEHVDNISNLFLNTGVDFYLHCKNIPLYLKENGYNIQTRHDCDDWMAPNYIQEIQNVYIKNINQNEEFLIQAQPIKLLYNTGEEYRTHTYTEDRPSMFLTLCQKEVTKYVCQQKHNKLSLTVKKVFTLDTGYVKLTVHDNNRLTTLLKRDKKIYEKN